MALLDGVKIISIRKIRTESKKLAVTWNGFFRWNLLRISRAFAGFARNEK